MLTEKRRPIPDGVWHVELGFPQDITLPTEQNVRLIYGTHAKEEALRDKNGPMTNLPQVVDVNPEDIFEIGTIDGHLDKIGIRKRYYESPKGLSHRDIIIIISWGSGKGRVRTVWSNLHDDTHTTLNKSNYLNPKEYGLDKDPAPNRTMSARNRKLLKRAKHTAKYSGEPIVFNQDHRKKKKT
jgi:hypothetical protein